MRTLLSHTLHILRPFLLVLLFHTSSFAGVESVITRIQGNQIVPSVNFSVTDFQYPKMSSGIPSTWGFTNKTAEAWLEAGVDRANLNYVGTAYDVDLVFSVVQWTYNYSTNQFTQLSPSAYTLRVSYNPLAATQEIECARHLFTGPHKISVTLSSVLDHTSQAPVSIPGNLFIQGLVNIERYYTFSTSTAPVAPTLKAFDIDADGNFKDELQISWPYIPGAEEYDLEWTFVNDYPQDGSLDGSPSSIRSPSAIPFSGSDFEHNCTRVRITDQNYRIPLLTDRGYLLFRMRGISRGGPTSTDFSKIVYGQWSIDVSSCIHVSDFPTSHRYYNSSSYLVGRTVVTDGHEKNKNWQVTTTFAEGGKKKEVISYFDGTLRNRQTITRINSADTLALIAETIYDNQGRPAVQTLPAPTSIAAKASYVLKYYPYFNLSSVNTPEPYNRTDFDTDNGTTCALTVNPMDSSSSASGVNGGASRYYSSKNNLAFSHRDYIPTAKGFPFTMVEYEPDNTNRIRTQTGVGKTHSYGSGHETKYFYGQPEQEQLDRLFATEAGYSQHYKKNMVQDANGQVSVTYLDMQGRTIATSLAGDSTSTLLALRDPVSNVSLIAANSQTVTVDLLGKVNQTDYNTGLDNNILSPDSSTLTYSAQKLVPAVNNYTVSYSLSAVPFPGECTGTYPAKYVVDVHLRDQCGAELLPSPPTQLSYSSASPPYTYTRVATQLPVGAYTVEKALSVDQNAANAYADQYLADAAANNPNCLLTYNDFFVQSQTLAHSTGCNITCDQCVTSLGTRPTQAGQAQTEWDALYNECTALCKSTSVCQLGYEAMLRDISPGGQYGAIAGPDFALSVYNTSGVLSLNSNGGIHPDWKHPYSAYLDELGNPSLIEIIHTNGYVPAVDNTSLLTIVNGRYYSTPQNLSNLSDFLDKWEDNWAKSLVKFHPEYQYFKWCDPLSTPTGSMCYSSDEFDYALMSTSAYNTANAPLTISTRPVCTTQVTLTGLTTASNLTILDPFFATAGFGGVTDPCSGTTYAQQMQSKISNYANSMSMSQYATFTAHCGTWYGSSADVMTACWTPANKTFGGTNPDQEWNLFKNFYLAEKQKLMQRAADQYMVTHYANNADYNYCGCIGENTYNPFLSCYSVPKNFALPWNVTSPVMDASQPCSIGISSLYTKKSRRFGIADLLPPPPSTTADFQNLQNQAGYQLYHQTGLCPLALDLKTWLNDMAKLGLTTNNRPLLQVQSFSTRLYEAISGKTATTTNYTQYTWNTSGSASTLNVSFSPTPPAACSSSVLSLILPAGWQWSNYNTAWKINSFTDISPTSTGFNIKAEVDSDNNPATPPIYLVLTGTTCLPLQGCDATFTQTDCIPSAEGKDLQDLMNLLSANNQLENMSGQDISVAPYSSVFNRRLASYFDASTNCTGKVWWTKISSTEYHINPDNCIGRSDRYSFKITFNSAVANTNVFSNCNSDPAFSAGSGNFTMDVNNTTPNKGLFQLIKQTDIQSYTYPVNVGNCSYPNDCKTQEHEFKGDLEKLLNGLVSTVPPTTTGTTLTGTQWFSTGMHNFLSVTGTESFAAYNPVTSSSFSVTIADKNNASIPNPVFGTIQLYSPNPTQPAIDYTQIQSFFYLVADESKMVNGKTYEFTVQAVISGHQAATTLRGISSFPLRNCKDCSPDATPLLDCQVESVAYVDTLVALGISNVQGSNPDINFVPVDFCNYVNCWRDYTNYLRAVQCTTATQNTYISLPQFCQGGWSSYSLDYITYYNAVSSLFASQPYLFLNLKDFCQQGISAYCVPNYNYYITTWAAQTPHVPPVANTISAYCVGYPSYPYCDPYPPSVPTYTTLVQQSSCDSFQLSLSTANAQAQYSQYIKSVRDKFIKDYTKHCMDHAIETLSMTYGDKEYNYTLYYYDEAGNLVRTIPPAGVKTLSLTATYPGGGTIGQKIKSDRKAGTRNVYTHHTFATTYTYNSLNQLTKQNTPDAGTSEFWYDKLGRLVVSRNAKQFGYSPSAYSYTLYDNLGRTIEVGQLQNTVAMTDNIARDKTTPTLASWIGSSTNRVEVTKTFYDTPVVTGLPSTQDNLRNRVSSSSYQDTYNSSPTVFDYALHYSYDIHGNVKTLMPDNLKLHTFLGASITTQRFKKIDYNYDLISGNVNDVHYQTGSIDAFHHHYEYDASNRLTNAYTSNLPSPNSQLITAGSGWDQDAKYFYYPHGPLERAELGHNKAQGTDYAYTVQGWIKGVNSNSLRTNRDIGKDANVAAGNLDQYIGSDEYGYSLGYFAGDYFAAGQVAGGPLASVTSMFLTAQGSSSDLNNATPSLYNGNIRNMVTSIRQFMPTSTTSAQACAYKYDQLNRIKSMKMYNNADITNNIWQNTSQNNTDYAESYKYDANGNILKLKRNGIATINTSMDDLKYYFYDANNTPYNPEVSTPYNPTNRLAYITDAAIATNYAVDIDNQNASNYTYDAIGNLKSDLQEQIANIDWTVYGKIKTLTRTTGSNKSDLEFRYDPSGNRILKISKPRSGGNPGSSTNWVYTVYTRDAQGNTLATYNLTGAITDMKLKELYLYGSNRVGIMNQNTAVTLTPSATDFSVTRGSKNYELNNHLGNVLVTVSDHKIPHNSTTSPGTIDYFNADVTSANDYYSFGAPMPNRSFTGTTYRYGFNGKEKQDELHGNSGDAYDYGKRMYDSRLGRWMSSDPAAFAFPGWSTYRAFFDNPIYWKDNDGGIEFPLKGTTAINKNEAVYRTQPCVWVKKANDWISQTGNFEGGLTQAYLNYQNNPDANTLIRTSRWNTLRMSTTSQPMTSPHVGTDFRADVGTDVYSLGKGTIEQIDLKNGVLTVKYGEDLITFRHLSTIDPTLKNGAVIYEGQIVAQSGRTNLSKDQKAHLHIEAQNANINPEAKNYGTVTNKEFFTTYGGDYKQLPAYKEDHPDAAPASGGLGVGSSGGYVAQPDNTAVVKSVNPVSNQKVKDQ